MAGLWLCVWGSLGSSFVAAYKLFDPHFASGWFAPFSVAIYFAGGFLLAVAVRFPIWVHGPEADLDDGDESEL